MTDTNAVFEPTLGNLGDAFGGADSARRKRITEAEAGGASFDGLTDRDIAQMSERAIYAVMAMQTYRGRFLGEMKQVELLASYIVGTAISDSTIRGVDAIAEGKVDREKVLETIRQNLATVADRCDAQDQLRRRADMSNNAQVLAGMMARQNGPTTTRNHAADA